MEYLLLQLPLVDTKCDFVELYQSIYINLVRKNYVFWLILLKNNCAYSFMWIAIYWVPRIDTYRGDKISMHHDAPVNRYTPSVPVKKISNPCRPLEIDASVSERPGLLLVWNRVILPTITMTEFLATLKPWHGNKCDKLFQEKDICHEYS